MIRNIPGGETILRRGGGQRGNNNRGFGAAAAQVLINGRRMSGKINNMSTALARIQATQVERIELIRGNAEGLDIRNEGIIYNVILQEGTENSFSSLLEVGVTDIDGMSTEPGILGSYNANRGPLEFGLSYQYETRPRLNLVDEDVLNADRTPREFRSLFDAQTRAKHIFTGTVGYEFENGAIAKLTGNGGCVHPHFHGLKIFGTKQTAISNLTEAYSLHNSEINPEPVPITEPYPEKEVREKVIHSFVDSILDPSITPLVPLQDVYDVMSVCFAAEEAMNTGNTIQVNYLS